MSERCRHLRQAQLCVSGEAHLQAKEAGDNPVNDTVGFGVALGGEQGRLMQGRVHGFVPRFNVSGR